MRGIAATKTLLPLQNPYVEAARRQLAGARNRKLPTVRLLRCSDTVGEVRGRRASLRITEVRDILGALLPLGEPLELQNLSAGGFAVTSPFEFLAGTEHVFGFGLPGGHLIQLNARTVYSHRPGADAIYRVGFSFVAATPQDELAITVLADIAKTLIPPKTTPRVKRRAS